MYMTRSPVRCAASTLALACIMAGCESGASSEGPTPAPPSPSAVAFTGIEGDFVRSKVGGRVSPVALSEARVVAFAGANVQPRMFGGPAPFASVSVGSTGQFALSLPPGNYTVAVYTVTHVRGRIPCITRQSVVKPGVNEHLALACT
jgi:xanthosine utilization system XapX-like protein